MRVGRWFVVTVATALAVAWAAAPAAARPEFLLRYQNDPMRKAGVDGCGACHVKPEGGGARNDFGAAFDAAGREITPQVRAAFPSHFTFTSATLPDGSTFHFADPKSQVAIVERGTERIVADLAAITAPKAAPIPPAANRMSFFVTSLGVPRGGHLGGLAGADRLCQTLAEAASAGDRTWRAYLSSSFEGAAAVNAGDRIGAGPWYNAAGRLVARGAIDLHRRPALDPTLALTESGAAVPADAVVFTGTLADGTAAIDRTCGNWTDTTGEAAAGGPGAGWNAARTASCAAAGPATGAPAPRLFCFAIR
ncbi:MAG: hypothetical protein AB7U83_21945 [Vicinamibacterales bacterium]